jgi:hypothetical protein
METYRSTILEEVSVDEFQKLLADVEMQNGQPVILSLYGFNIKEIDGKKYLVATTEEEYKSVYGEEEFQRIRPGRGCWVAGIANCVPDGCSSCRYIPAPPGFPGYNRCVCEGP